MVKSSKKQKKLNVTFRENDYEENEWIYKKINRQRYEEKRERIVFLFFIFF